jgi:hypothetical protein
VCEPAGAVPSVFPGGPAAEMSGLNVVSAAVIRTPHVARIRQFPRGHESKIWAKSDCVAQNPTALHAENSRRR